MLTIIAGIVIAYFVIMFLPLFFEIFGAFLDIFLTTDKNENSTFKNNIIQNSVATPSQELLTKESVTNDQIDNKIHSTNETVDTKVDKTAELSKQISQTFIFFKNGSMMFNGEFFFDSSTKTKVSLVRVTEITLSANSSFIVEFRKLEGGSGKIIIPMSDIREDCIADIYYLIGLFKKIH